MVGIRRKTGFVQTGNPVRYKNPWSAHQSLPSKIMSRSKVLEHTDTYGQVQVCRKVSCWDALWGACVS